MTNFKALFGADRRSIAHISRKVATVACTRGREAIELLVESIADLSQIQNRSGDRKAAVEMQIEPGALHPELRDLTARIEQTRAGQERLKSRCRRPRSTRLIYKPGNRCDKAACAGCTAPRDSARDGEKETAGKGNRI